MTFAGLLFVLAQATFMPPPTAAPPPSPGSDPFQREQAQYEQELRRSCISEKGVRVIITAWASNRTAAAAVPKGYRELENDVATAAYSQPINMVQLERAIRASAKAASERELRRAEDGINVLRQLSPEDRAVYARRFTYTQPRVPPAICK
ncbi:MAG: hypothetical protein KGN34_09720 [Sphingomonadales bacterium]|nr:hypothetical protein [Sphingomonadales bacterium]